MKVGTGRIFNSTCFEIFVPVFPVFYRFFPVFPPLLSIQLGSTDGRTDEVRIIAYSRKYAKKGLRDQTLEQIGVELNLIWSNLNEDSFDEIPS